MRLLSVLALLLLCACVQAPEPTPEPAAPVLSLPTVKARVEDLPRLLQAPGVVQLPPGSSYTLKFQTAGRIAEVHVREGDRVTAGQVLAALDPRLADAQVRLDQAGVQTSDATVRQNQAQVESALAGVRKAESSLKLARDVRDRQANLVREKIGARKDLVAAEAAVHTAQAELESARAQVRAARSLTEATQLQTEQARLTTERDQTQLELLTMTSPIAGTVRRRLLNPGDVVDSSTPVFELANRSDVQIQMAVPTQQMDGVKTGLPVDIPGRRGRIVLVRGSVDPATSTVAVVARMANPHGDLRDNQVVEATIELGVARRAITVPASALFPDPSEPDRKMVARVVHGKLERASVTTGLHYRDRVQILKGIQAGETIVAEGAYGVPNGTEIR